MFMEGNHSAKLLKKNINAPLSWHLKNRSRWNYWLGLGSNRLAKGFSALTGIPTMTAELSIRVFRANGQIENYGTVGYRVVTTAFVNFMVDELVTETTTWGDFKFHDSGVGVTAENITDTDIETTDGESKATGTQLEGASANIYRSVGTISYTTTKAITEHTLTNNGADATGICIDRTVFGAINVNNGDSIEHTYELTVNSGG
jgi:hypothetical protein